MKEDNKEPEDDGIDWHDFVVVQAIDLYDDMENDQYEDADHKD